MPQAGPRSARAKTWLGSELGSRVASALVLAAVALWEAYVGGWPCALFWFAAGIASLLEWLAMARIEPRRPVAGLLGLGLAAASSAALGLISVPIAAAAALVAAAAASVLLQGGSDRLWAVEGFLCAAIITVVPPLVRAHPQLGLTGLLWMFAVVWFTDIAAYFTGRRLGGPKLWPSVSPKKTWSGFAGGLVAGTAAGLAVVVIATEGFGWSAPVALGWIALGSAVASVAGQLGDLGESALKRRFDVKDSGHLIPGHGGVMDRLDAFWAVSLLMAVLLMLMRPIQG